MAIRVLMIILLIILIMIYVYLKRKYAYWELTNVPHIEPQFPYGNIKGIMKKIHSAFLLQKYYKQMKGEGPFGGIYFFHKPVVLALDLEFIKNILIKHFNHFHDRGVYHNERDDPLSAHLFSINGQKWKDLRAKLTPTFSSGKMKFMFPTVTEVAANFEKCLEEIVAKNPILEIKDVLGRFTTDVIGTCAFGIECNSLKDPNTKFRIMGKKVFDTPKKSGLKPFFSSQFKSMARLLRMKVIHEDVSEFFMGVVSETIDYREKHNIHRNDFMDLLIDIKNNQVSDAHGELTVNQIAANAFIFFLAGFESSSTTMTFVLYELAINRDIQQRLRDEINTVIAEYDGNFTYEAMMSMKYMDQVINETLRKYPPVGSLIRQATKDYYVPEVKFTIPRKTSVFIPVYGIHHDPEYYPNPSKFNPDRFAPEQVKKRKPCTFLPFGDGPRNCIGIRFGMLQTKVGLVTLLTKFDFSVGENLKIPLEFSQTQPILSSVHGVYLELTKL